jgi:hypothetical protein
LRNVVSLKKADISEVLTVSIIRAMKKPRTKNADKAKSWPDQWGNGLQHQQF